MILREWSLEAVHCARWKLDTKDERSDIERSRDARSPLVITHHPPLEEVAPSRALCEGKETEEEECSNSFQHSVPPSPPRRRRYSLQREMEKLSASDLSTSIQQPILDYL